MLEKPNDIALFNLKKTANVKAKILWNPQKGAIPTKTPSAIERDFFVFESSFLSMSSRKNCLIPFFFKRKKKSRGFI